MLHFNAYLNKSHEYGTSPWHWYFTSALPRALLAGLPLALAALPAVPRARGLVLLPCCFVGAYSLLPHKELRFVLYVVPLLNAAAAATLARLHRALPPLAVVYAPGGGAAAQPSPFAPSGPTTKRKPRASLQARAAALLGRLAVVGALLLSLVCSGLFLAASRRNYPGGEALEALHGMVTPREAQRRRGGLRVHVGVDAAMSGVSRFLERPAPWSYSKDESLSTAQDFQRFGYLLAAPGAEVGGFEVAHVAEGFARFQLWPPALLTEPKVLVLKRKTQKETVAPKAKGSDDYF